MAIELNLTGGSKSFGIRDAVAESTPTMGIANVEKAAQLGSHYVGQLGQDSAYKVAQGLLRRFIGQTQAADVGAYMAALEQAWEQVLTQESDS